MDWCCLSEGAAEYGGTVHQYLHIVLFLGEGRALILYCPHDRQIRLEISLCLACVEM